MIDLHIHILPGLDDGAESWEDALEMAEIAVESRTECLAATIHSNLPGNHPPGLKDSYLMRLSRFRMLLQAENIPLSVCPGMEIFVREGFLEKLKAGELLTLNGTHYPLLEFDMAAPAFEIYQALDHVLEAGFLPVIAHPERYRCIQRVPAHVYEWYRMGAVIQLNKGSILGSFGGKVRRTADTLLRHRLAAVVASDAHSSVVRTPRMKELWEYLADRFGQECPRLLLEENPGRILRGERVIWRQPAGYDYSAAGGESAAAFWGGDGRNA